MTPPEGMEPPTVKILLAEDDEKTAAFIARGLRQETYTVDHAPDGREALLLALSGEYDVAVVDVMMPRLDGLEVVERVRAAGIDLPILILSAKGTVGDRVRGLQTGSDDYLAKPFAFSELLARVQALVRRTLSVPERQELRVGDLRLDVLRRKAYRGEEEIALQPLELSLLEYLMRHAGRVVSKTMIMEHVWDYHFDPQTNVVEVRVCRLREKVDKPFETKLIHTVRGCGYVLEER